MYSANALVNQIFFRNLNKQPNDVIKLLKQYKITAKKCICSNNKFKIKQVHKNSQQAELTLNVLKQFLSDTFQSHIKNIKTCIRPDFLDGFYTVLVITFEIA